jgi:hypothetical protein
MVHCINRARRTPLLIVLSVLAGSIAVGSRVGQARGGLQSASVSTDASFALNPVPAAPAPASHLTLSLWGVPETDLCGEYYLGDGLGVNCSLTLGSDHRFTFRWRGCLGEYDRNEGRWELSGDVVTMQPERPNKREGFEGMNVRFVPIVSGTRLFLVDENETPGFCAAAGRGDLPSGDRIHGNDYIKRTVGLLPSLSDKPVIPERFVEFYEKGPVVAKVIWLGPGGRVTLNKGSADRLRVGMLLGLNRFDGIEVKVTEVQEREATGDVFYYWNSDREVKVGDEFTTGSYWHRPWGTGYPRYRRPPERGTK